MGIEGEGDAVCEEQAPLASFKSIMVFEQLTAEISYHDDEDNNANNDDNVLTKE